MIRRPKTRLAVAGFFYVVLLSGCSSAETDTSSPNDETPVSVVAGPTTDTTDTTETTETTEPTETTGKFVPPSLARQTLTASVADGSSADCERTCNLDIYFWGGQGGLELESSADTEITIVGPPKDDCFTPEGVVEFKPSDEVGTTCTIIVVAAGNQEYEETEFVVIVRAAVFGSTGWKSPSIGLGDNNIDVYFFVTVTKSEGALGAANFDLTDIGGTADNRTSAAGPHSFKIGKCPDLGSVSGFVRFSHDAGGNHWAAGPDLEPKLMSFDCAEAGQSDPGTDT